MNGQNAELGALMQDLNDPPIDEIGALPFDSFMKKADRRALAAALNTLLASPTFASRRQGASLDVGELLEEILCWVRTLGGSQTLKALIVSDEVYGFLPPHPANPPTNRPIVALMKQAKAFGVGVVFATQNPMALDYRALSHAGIWCLGRLQTDADRVRVPASWRRVSPCQAT